jgi:16S rRNA (guanine527-N7)-methyltransferase
MDAARIAELLEPFLDAELVPEQLNRISIYIDLLLHWNARINLSAVREPEQIVTRHFGESLFAASRLLPMDEATAASPQTQDPQCVVDLGSGAGFPGIPLKIWSPQTAVTLIESNHKKATFLREVIRALTLTSTDVFPNRAETYPKASASLVALRAVERFDQILPVAQSLLAPAGRLALLIGESQAPIARQTLRSLVWSSPTPLPGSQSRALLVGDRG